MICSPGYGDAVDGLAQNIFGDTRSGSLAGPLGLLIIVLLALGTVLLIRNMNARLRRLPDRFPTPADSVASDESLDEGPSPDRPAEPGQRG